VQTTYKTSQSCTASGADGRGSVPASGRRSATAAARAAPAPSPPAAREGIDADGAVGQGVASSTSSPRADRRGELRRAVRRRMRDPRPTLHLEIDAAWSTARSTSSRVQYATSARSSTKSSKRPASRGDTARRFAPGRPAEWGNDARTRRRPQPRLAAWRAPAALPRWLVSNRKMDRARSAGVLLTAPGCRSWCHRSTEPVVGRQ
jgi:hypothetical protein